MREALGSAVRVPVAAQLDEASLALQEALDTNRAQVAKDLEELQRR